MEIQLNEISKNSIIINYVSFIYSIKLINKFNNNISVCVFNRKDITTNMVATYVTYVCLFIGVTLVWPFILLGVNFVLISKLVKSNNKSKQVDSQHTSKNEDSSIK